ncbi:MAG: serine/threonine protein kinase [Desulfurococcales archaeon]|nr:serine/threonine protein kinase [Desulfurococcales archaeon]
MKIWKIIILFIIINIMLVAYANLSTDVYVKFNEVIDETNLGVNWQYAEESITQTYYNGENIYMVTLQLYSNTYTGILELYIDNNYMLEGFYYEYSSGSYILVYFTPSVPLKLSSIESTSGEQTTQTTTIDIYDETGLIYSDTVPLQVTYKGPTSYYGYNSYQIIVESYYDGSWNTEIELYYAPDYQAIIGLYIPGIIKISSPQITQPPIEEEQPIITGNNEEINTSDNTTTEESSPIDLLLGLITLILVIGAPAYYIGRRRRGKPDHTEKPIPALHRHEKILQEHYGQEAKTVNNTSIGKVAEISLVKPRVRIEPGQRAEITVRYNCPEGCRITAQRPAGADWIVVSPPYVEARGEGNVLFILEALHNASIGSYPVYFKVEPGDSLATASVEITQPTGATEREEEALHIPSTYIPGYRIIRPLGSGGFSTVYLAEKDQGELVALKIPKLELGATVSGNLSEQFRREAETWSRLDHENIVKVIDYGIKPLPYIAMEYMPGGSLRERLEKEGKPTIGEAVKIAIDIGEALSYAHHMGVVHRDLKPENVLFTKDGRAKLTDFGLAKVMLQASMSSASGFKGTILYAAPEQVDPASYGSPDWRTDIWQYGALLYELLTGRPPFTADNPLALINKIINEEPLPPSHYNSSVPGWLDEIVMKCLRKKKEDRWKSIDLVLDRLYQMRNTIGLK